MVVKGREGVMHLDECDGNEGLMRWDECGRGGQTQSRCGIGGVDLGCLVGVTNGVAC